MSDWLRGNGPESDGLGRDMELAEALRSLDPSSSDPSYWFRFRGLVVKSAARELARRRLVAQLTVGDVMSSWARTIVPTAVLAAALAGMLMVRSDTSQAPVLEELLLSEITGATVPFLAAPEGTQGAVFFASEPGVY